MSGTPPPAGAWRANIAATLLVLATTLPVLFLKAPPLVDVLGHIGRYTLQTGLASDPWVQTWYAFEWQVIGNLGADLLVEATHETLGVMGAARLAVVLVPLLAATGVVLLSRRIHGRVTPFAVAALSLVYALPFSWGFLNFSLAMASALLAFALWLRLGASTLRLAIFVPVSLGLWLCHTFGWAFLGILSAGESLARQDRKASSFLGRLTGTARDCAPLLAPLVPMLLWRSTATGAGIEGWFDWSQKLQWLLSIQRLEWKAADLASAAILLALPWAALHRSFRLDPRIAVPAAIASAAFLLLPKQIFGSVYADMRLVPYAVLVALLAVRDAGTQRLRRWLMAGAVVFLGFRLALTADVYHERERELDRHMPALDAIPRHARVAMLVEIPCQSDWALPWFSHLGSLALTRKPVFVNDQWANASMNPLRVHFPAAGAYATDDKQLFFSARCGMAPTLPQALRALPIGAFTHVWLVGRPLSSVPQHPHLTPAWHSDDAAVFRVSVTKGQVGPALGSSKIFRVNRGR